MPALATEILVTETEDFEHFSSRKVKENVGKKAEFVKNRPIDFEEPKFGSTGRHKFLESRFEFCKAFCVSECLGSSINNILAEM